MPENVDFRAFANPSAKPRVSTLPFMKQGKAPFVSDDSLRRTLDAQRGCNALRDQTILLVSHFVGLRAMELAALKVQDVFDFRSGQVKDTIRLLVTKGDRFREVFLVDEETRDHVARHVQSRGVRPDAPLFLSQRGRAFSANTMQRLVANLYKKAGVRGSSHSGRRSFATRLINSGADIYSVKELLGHSSIVTTQVYFATDPLRLKRLAQLR